MSNLKQVSLEDFKNAKTISIRWPDYSAKPHEDTSIFRIRNEESDGCDHRTKCRVNLYHFVAGAEKSNSGDIICDPSLVADAIVEDIINAVGYINPENLRFGATPLCKELIGKEYRLIATIAYQKLKNEYQASREAILQK